MISMVLASKKMRREMRELGRAWSIERWASRWPRNGTNRRSARDAAGQLPISLDGPGSGPGPNARIRVGRRAPPPRPLRAS